MNTLLKYHGGKWKIAPWIVRLMPAHKCYVEPFGGSAAVLLHKQSAMTEVYNDLNGDVVNVFRTVRDNINELSKLIALTPYSREELVNAYEPTEDNVEAARRFLVRSQMAISTTSLNEKTGFRAHINSKDYASQPYTWACLPETILKVRRRFERVIIENTHYLSLFDRYDLPKTLWFLDPPYPKDVRTSASNRRGYQFDFTVEDHLELLERCKQLQGPVMLATYKNYLYDEQLEGWHQVSTKGFTDSRNKSKSIETLYLNYEPPQLLFK